MAKTSKIVKNQDRREIAARYAARRRELKAVIANPRSTPEQRDDAARALRAMPRDASATRIRNRCQMTGRPRAYYRKLKMSRIALRSLGSMGQVPGLVKSSW